MSFADVRGRRAEVESAFLEGWRKAHSWWVESDRNAWDGSDAYARLAYGVTTACANCRCQIINIHVDPIACLKCGEPRQTQTDQHREREVSAIEGFLGKQAIKPLHFIGDGRDAFADHPPAPAKKRGRR